jgi:hypothetical protein
MKWIIVMLVFTRCLGSVGNVEGSYVGYFEHEFAINDDTLIVSKANDAGNIYNLSRHTGTARKKNGKLLPKEVKIESWILEYNKETKILKEARKGRIIIWNSQGDLQMGNTIYKRMK